MYDSHTWPETRRSETFHSQASKLWEFVTDELVRICNYSAQSLKSLLSLNLTSATAFTHVYCHGIVVSMFTFVLVCQHLLA